MQSIRKAKNLRGESVHNEILFLCEHKLPCLGYKEVLVLLLRYYAECRCTIESFFFSFVATQRSDGYESENRYPFDGNRAIIFYCVAESILFVSLFHEE